MAYATLTNTTGDVLVVGGAIMQPAAVATYNEFEFNRMVEHFGPVDGIAGVTCVILSDAGDTAADSSEILAVSGALSGLTTTAKGSLVAAVNEVDALAKTKLHAPTPAVYSEVPADLAAVLVAAGLMVAEGS